MVYGGGWQLNVSPACASEQLFKAILATTRVTGTAPLLSWYAACTSRATLIELILATVVAVV
jgi:hypothetical protein